MYPMALKRAHLAAHPAQRRRRSERERQRDAKPDDRSPVPAVRRLDNEDRGEREHAEDQLGRGELHHVVEAVEASSLAVEKFEQLVVHRSDIAGPRLRAR
jgi:hypothetical protein